MSWTCPHCNIIQVITRENSDVSHSIAPVGKFAESPKSVKYVSVFYTIETVRCASENCKKITCYLRIASINNDANRDNEIENSVFFESQIYPNPSGRSFPIGVPDQFLKDYQEAWAIINLSPKSSATLARRCLQGMIRDFCGIKERTLFDEINVLEKMIVEEKLPRGVDQDTVSAMRAVKDIGNIGAHMTEIDGIIVEVDPDEAKILLGLIEMIFTDWYVARAKRKEMLENVVAVRTEKLQ